MEVELSSQLHRNIVGVYLTSEFAILTQPPRLTYSLFDILSLNIYDDYAPSKSTTDLGEAIFSLNAEYCACCWQVQST